jgi:2-hydroxychromene-2-carboxylate isomerase
MKQITFWLDFISPYAYLAFERLPDALAGLSYSVSYKPVLLGALFMHHGHVAPADVPPKRLWVYRQALWLGRANGIPIDMPASHPYNPLPHLRLALATTPTGEISRYVAETIFHDVWRGGGDAADPSRLSALSERLALVREGSGDEAKAQLRTNTEQAVQAGVFGVPAFTVEGETAWGFDSLPMLRAMVEGDPWFDSAEWHDPTNRPGLASPK